MPRPTILVSILAALVLLLSACDPAGNGGNGDAAYGEDDLDQAVTSVGNDLGELGTAFETELGVAALDAFPGAFPAVSEPVVVSDGALSLRFIRPSQAGSLPAASGRGTKVPSTGWTPGTPTTSCCSGPSWTPRTTRTPRPSRSTGA